MAFNIQVRYGSRSFEGREDSQGSQFSRDRCKRLEMLATGFTGRRSRNTTSTGRASIAWKSIGLFRRAENAERCRQPLNTGGLGGFMG
jgi:hypothetical protein